MRRIVRVLVAETILNDTQQGSKAFRCLLECEIERKPFALRNGFVQQIIRNAYVQYAVIII